MLCIPEINRACNNTAALSDLPFSADSDQTALDYIRHIQAFLGSSSTNLFRIDINYVRTCTLCHNSITSAQQTENFLIYPVIDGTNLSDFKCSAAHCGSINHKERLNILSAPPYLILARDAQSGPGILNPTDHMRLTTREEQNKSRVYTLLGYIVHTGSHYYCLGRRGEQIYMMNDANVYPCTTWLDFSQAVIYLYKLE
jgi:hypothetical protein